MTVPEQIFCLIRNEIYGTPLPADTEYDIRKIYILSRRHDLAHLTGGALLCNKILSDGKAYDAFKDNVSFAVLRVEQQTAELKKIKQTFDGAKIPYIPLKGAVLRQYYPEPWMRTSCDIDILIREEDLNRATDTLIASGFETDGKKNFHDVHFYSDDIHLELHFNIYENNKQLDAVLSEVWDYAEKVGDYEYRELPEYFVFHHIAHMAYHFIGGGCGIRPFIDLRVLKDENFYSEEKLLPLLEKCNLIKFYRSVCKLADVWLDGGRHDDLTLQMEEYILRGGVYGNSDNANAAGAAKSKGKRKYLLKIAFPPYKTMCIIYPSLKKRKILLPFYYIHRIFAKLFGKDRKKVKAKIDNTMSQSEENILSVGKLLTDLELK
ncbi:MAG: nucleotidyltransferase family protein [Clostridia bacterium]|nr:nucleotidyltransferase family protein [Clostridia bacterium]